MTRGNYTLVLKWRNIGAEHLNFQEIVQFQSSFSALKVHMVYVSFCYG